ncbi:helix-turn-helix transcriptional regulator [Photobacterium frigidiphilum]|uniref:Helix-turn-helix transcriptional regulator n=1 Tax=Photobacterium frigidiphilum TaxID=264736 RepID=A0A2T3JFL0_9GAMM|nr:PAS and helix-turn-helix domain-containing protein [Photobacterium frigidiphilum]PSU47732.1 helix-turn-helix transcriptional regulator [Photobacterium frigidiphilum]
MLDTTPTPAGLKSKGGQFVFANEAYRQLVNAPKEIEGLFDCDLPCDTAQFASIFAQQDRHVMLSNKTVSTIDIHNYAHGYDAFSFNKRPVVINGETWGVQFNAVNLKELICVEAFAEIMTFDKSHKSFSSVRLGEMQLTPSQEIVLFWLLRGRQTKQIALMIHRTPKAVEKQIANLIVRFAIFGVTNRASLIDYARCNGWLSVIPDQLLKQPVSIMINE